MTIVEERTMITGGVDTHSEVHVAAALDPLGGLLGTREFPATAAGYAGLLGWLGKFGDVALVGVEGTGSYGAGLARYLAARGVRVECPCLALPRNHPSPDSPPCSRPECGM